MEFDINKLESLSLSKNKKSKIDLTEEEIAFMYNIFNLIINSEDYEQTTEYLAGIYNMSVSDIKFIRNFYFYKYASREEKLIYSQKNKELKKIRRKEGFIDITAMISITIVISVVGITLAIALYNLL